jgi:hypothetical protein
MTLEDSETAIERRGERPRAIAPRRLILLTSAPSGSALSA